MLADGFFDKYCFSSINYIVHLLETETDILEKIAIFQQIPDVDKTYYVEIYLMHILKIENNYPVVCKHHTLIHTDFIELLKKEVNKKNITVKNIYIKYKLLHKNKISEIEEKYKIGLWKNLQ
jgi:hypothetical protein